MLNYNDYFGPMATVLVTGAAGFIGAHVAAALRKRGDTVIAVDNFNDYYDVTLKKDRVAALLGDLTVQDVDIADPEALTKVITQPIDAICHLAAQAGVRYSIDHPEAYIHSNLVGTHTILELARHQNIKKVVMASSSSVYGTIDTYPWTETMNVDQPISLYAATKKANELEAYTYHHLYGINIAALRFFTVYGPWGRPDMAYFKFTNAIRRGQAIDVYNNGDMERDFTYIDDIVDGILKSIDACDGYAVMNLGNNQPVTLMEFITTLENLLEKKVEHNFLPLQPGDVLKTYADITKAQKTLGWQPQTNLQNGLAQFVDWHKQYYQTL